MESVWSVSKLSTESVGSRHELCSHRRRRRDSTVSSRWHRRCVLGFNPACHETIAHLSVHLDDLARSHRPDLMLKLTSRRPDWWTPRTGFGPRVGLYRPPCNMVMTIIMSSLELSSTGCHMSICSTLLSFVPMLILALLSTCHDVFHSQLKTYLVSKFFPP